MRLKNKKAHFFIVLILLAIVVWVINPFEDKTIRMVELQETAIDLMPPLSELVLENDKHLLGHFKTQTIAKVEQGFPETFDMAVSNKNLVFKKDVLKTDINLRQTIDKYLLLHPEVGVEGVRYLLAQQIVANAKNDAQAKKYFSQLDKVFTAYVNLLRQMESFPEANQHVELQQQFAKIKKLRRQYLGNKLADEFFKVEESKMQAYLKAQNNKIGNNKK